MDGPFSGSSRAALAVLLLAGWLGLTVTGSLLHLLAILARIRRFNVGMPRPQPARDRLTTLVAAVALAALAFSNTAALGSLRIPAAVLALALAALLASRVITLAMRALVPSRAFGN